MQGVGYYVFDCDGNLLLVNKKEAKDIYKDYEGRHGWVVPGATYPFNKKTSAENKLKDCALSFLFEDIPYSKNLKNRVLPKNAGNWIHQTGGKQKKEHTFDNYLIQLPFLEDDEKQLLVSAKKNNKISEVKFFEMLELPNLAKLTADFLKSLLFHRLDYFPNRLGPAGQEEFEKCLGDESRRFHLLDMAGRPGGYGVVYKVLDIPTLFPRAIKIARPNPNDKKWKERFIVEGTTLMRILSKNLDNSIEKVFSINTVDKRRGDSIYFILKELIQGDTLQNWFENDGRERLNDNLIHAIMRRLIKALKQIHCLKPAICHRDLKPNNVMMSFKTPGYKEIERLTIIDFGLCKSPLTGINTSEDVLIGNAIYQSVHTINYYNEHNVIDDYYSSLQTFHWLLFGRDPYQSDRKRISRDKENGKDTFLQKNSLDFKVEDRQKSIRLFRSFFDIIKIFYTHKPSPYNKPTVQKEIMKKIHNLFS